jgi:hypothetical protein
MRPLSLQIANGLIGPTKTLFVPAEFLFNALGRGGGHLARFMHVHDTNLVVIRIDRWI